MRFHEEVSRIRTVGAWCLRGIVLGIVLLLAGCATARIVGDTYRDPERGFQVRLPPAPWQVQTLDGAAVSLVAPDLRAGMALNVDCPGGEPGELSWVARHLFFGLQDADIQESDTIRVLDITAVRTHVRARLDNQPIEVEGVTFRRAGCLYDFIYTAPPAAFPQGRTDFEAFVQSWTPLTER